MPQPEKSPFSFQNYTSLPFDQAKEVVEHLTKEFEQAESTRQYDVERAQEAVNTWKNAFWDESDYEWFDEFNLTPYQVPFARVPINNLVSQQRNTRFRFEILPSDPQSYERHRKNREEYVQEYGDEHRTLQEAREYYDKHADDELADAITTYYHNIRNQESTKHVESEAFENGLITGCDFLKTIYSNKSGEDGRIKTERRSVRSMIYDRSSVDYFLRDAEFIGEVHRMYKTDLKTMFPGHAQNIEKRFKKYSNLHRSGGMHLTDPRHRNWKQFYDFEQTTEDERLKVAEFWYKDTEDRIELVQKDTGHSRLIEHGWGREQILDHLHEVELDRITEEVKKGERDAEFFDRPKQEIKADINQIVNRKYELRPTQAEAWYKAVFSHYALFEFKRSPLPHDGHPYTPFFAQFTEGWYTGIIDDIKDLLLALNKAFMFREIMLANGAKGALVVDKKAVNQSGYSVDDIKELWSEVGAVIDLEVKGGRRLSDVFQQVTTIEQGLREINVVIQSLKQQILESVGVNQAQTGQVGNEAAASQVRQRIVQGQSNNGLIFDNFNRTLEYHVHNKVIPLVIAELRTKKPSAVRSLSNDKQRWIELTYDENFDMFANAIEKGTYATRLKTKPINSQRSQQRAAMLMELGNSNPNIDIEAAIEYSNWDEAHEFLKRNRELRREKMLDQLAQQVDMRQLQQIMAQAGVDQDTAEKILNKAKLEASKKVEQQNGQGMENIQKQARQMKKEAGIEQSIEDGRA